MLAGCGRLTLVPAAVTVQCALRAAHLPALRRAGELGVLLAAQLAAHARRRRHAQLAARAAALPADLVAFLHDPLAVAVAAGWPGVHLATQRLRLDLAAGPRLHPDVAGTPVRVVTGVDADAFVARFLAAVTAASEAPARRARAAPS